ncbi:MULTISPECIES: hypothetical protein [Mycobacterium]|uniref:hypothetical protein n=1 Tax=Mycobacterium TaxID=1763 RepID=UPI001EF06E0F|nr:MULTISPECIES: hypothetical protein [Mycobacterium]
MSRAAVEAPAPQTVPLVTDDASVIALIAEVDAILRAAARRLRCRPPAPPATGCALAVPKSAGRSWRLPAYPRHGPAHRIDAVQRSPPAPAGDHVEQEGR